MERAVPKRFSIEPYVEQGGIMGEELQHDEKAASSIMKRTALRHDFSVAKGYFREKQEFEGSEELAIKKVGVVNQRHEYEVGASNLSTLVRKDDSWILQVHDQQVAIEVDEWMQKHFKREKEKAPKLAFGEQFAKQFREEVVSGLRSAFWDEKRNILFRSSKRSFLVVASTSILSGSITYILNDIIRYNRFTSEDRISNAETSQLFGLILIMGFLVFGVLQSLQKAKNAQGSDKLLKDWEYVLPNFSVPSLVGGNISLVLNSGKLIRFKLS